MFLFEPRLPALSARTVDRGHSGDVRRGGNPEGSRWQKVERWSSGHSRVGHVYELQIRQSLGLRPDDLL